jgi:2'-5' RNA ligase
LNDSASVDLNTKMMSTLINTGTSKKVRLFIATQWIGDPAGIAACVPAEYLPCRIKPVPPEQWHLTWTFLGQTDPAIIPEIQERMTRVSEKHPPIPAYIDPPGWWPQASRAQVLACRVSPRQALVHLASELQEALTPLAKHTQMRVGKAFEPHLTIARLKPASRQRVNLSQLILPEMPPQPWHLDHLSLNQSTLTGEGPVYHCLFRQKLLPREASRQP